MPEMAKSQGFLFRRCRISGILAANKNGQSPAVRTCRTGALTPSEQL